MPFVAQINIYPVKSCDGRSVSEAVTLPSGSLQFDRQFALVDDDGRFINAKRTPLIHCMLLSVDPTTREFRVGRRGSGEELCGHLDADGEQLSDWLTRFFSIGVSIVENATTGFPDDLGANGPTVVSRATLEAVADWFPGLSVDEIRQRFRANIEIDGVEPFWEDRLFRADKLPQPFRIGSLLFGGINPCQRCVVPTRDPLSGEVTPDGFAKKFAERREHSLPDWASRNHFDHFYRLSTNTRLVGQQGGVIQVGDSVEAGA